VRDDWLLVDYFRGFMPSWLSGVMSMKVVTAVTLAVLVIVVVLKAVR